MVILIITVTGVLLFSFAWYSISRSRDVELESLRTRLEDLEKQCEAMETNRDSLKEILGDKEAILERLQQENNKKPHSNIELPDRISDEPDPGAYLIGKGLITLEQHAHAQDKMSSLQMDFISVCLTLGYIDLKTAKKVSTALKVGTKK